jgi:DNA/RNA-binding domain of Phe-tRNA-synthetase-like protein
VVDDDPLIEEGYVTAAVRDEHPDLRLCSIVTETTKTRSPRELKRRLAHLSSRFSGPRAVSMRSEPIPHAYRVFYRHIGLDPDDPQTRTPLEEVAMRRLIEGRFSSQDNVRDALLTAIVETGVPLWALDDDTLRGPLGIREAQARELLGEGPLANEMPAGRLVIADDRGVIAVLFGDVAETRRPTPATTRLRVFALQVAGVPELHLQEALWLCADALDGD